MIDPATGTVTLGEVSVGPTTTRSLLGETPLGNKLVEQAAGSPPWETCLTGVHALRDLRFTVYLTFEMGTLRQVRLALCDAREGTSWDDWSEKRERHKKAKQDAWLRKTLGAPTRTDQQGVRYEYSWGQVWSSFDRRAGSSCIVVSYPAIRSNA